MSLFVRLRRSLCRPLTSFLPYIFSEWRWALSRPLWDVIEPIDLSSTSLVTSLYLTFNDSYKTTESGPLFQCPHLLILRCFMVARRPSSSLTFTASRTHTFVLCSIQLICSSRRQVHSSNAEILFSSTNLSVQLSHPYVAMLHIRVFISFFFVSSLICKQL